MRAIGLELDVHCSTADCFCIVSSCDFVLQKNKLAASNKVSTKIKSVAFAGDGSYFITVGNRHVKFWYLENPSTDVRSSVTLYSVVIYL